MKKCPRCSNGSGALKPLSDFQRDATKHDGLQACCRICTNSARARLYDRKGTSLNDRYLTIKNRAARAHIEFRISLSEYREITSQPCIYGGAREPEVRIGLDRKDSLLPYLFDNLAACCPRHNWIKAAHFSVEEMNLIMRMVPRLATCGNSIAGRKKKAAR